MYVCSCVWVGVSGEVENRIHVTGKWKEAARAIAQSTEKIQGGTGLGRGVLTFIPLHKEKV